MPISKLQGVPLIPQRADGVCWCASAIMLHRYALTLGPATMKDPLSDKGTKYRWDNNLDWDSKDNAFLATTLVMKTHSAVPMNYAGLNDMLFSHGPIWAAGHKTWGGGNHGHVVAFCGAADTGVFVHDPEPVAQGSSFWLTWAQAQKYIDGVTASIKFLTAF